jgi:hypothetical protein
MESISKCKAKPLGTEYCLPSTLVTSHTLKVINMEIYTHTYLWKYRFMKIYLYLWKYICFIFVNSVKICMLPVITNEKNYQAYPGSPPVGAVIN